MASYLLMLILVNILKAESELNQTLYTSDPRVLNVKSRNLSSHLWTASSAENCLVNSWCRPQPEEPNSQFEYLFAERLVGLTWFEALELCREEPGNSSLLSLESLSEINWLVHQMNALSQYHSRSDEEYLWHVNAHRYLYNMKGSAWASGRLVGIDLPLFRRVEPKKCLRYSDSPFVGEGECFAIARNKSFDGGSALVDVNCTEPEARRVICKRAIDGTVTVSYSIKPEEQFPFVKSDWYQSPFDPLVFYRFVITEPYCGRTNFYCSKLICNQFGADLSDLESQNVFQKYNLLYQYSVY